MKLSVLLFRFLTLLLPLCLSSSVYIYLYPFFHGCAYPAPRAPTNGLKSGPGPQAATAPFRLLVFGDPQLEGDTALPNPLEWAFPSLSVLRERYRSHPTAGLLSALVGGGTGLITKDIPKFLQYYRKRVDLFGNDYYLAHIYRTLLWWTGPSHVAVLGDLLGSQWIEDEEFRRRAWRFWKRVFSGGERVGNHLAEGARTEILGEDATWAKRVINVAGNHDIGYAGDVDETRVKRFERSFGLVNWDIRFRLADATLLSENNSTATSPPEIHLIVLNSMNLDTPTLSQSLQQQTYDFINNVIRASKPVEDRRTFTLLLTHIPLHKDAGTCKDGPFFDFYGPGAFRGGVKEQNHISYTSGKGILEGIYGMNANPDAPGHGVGRNGLILTGHDHEGCDVYHYVLADDESKDGIWKAVHWTKARPFIHRDRPGIREITVRSMMGDYGGSAGLLSVWFDADLAEWRFDYSTCAVGVQHIWWAVHIADAVSLLLFVCAVIARCLERGSPLTNFRQLLVISTRKLGNKSKTS